MKRFVLLDTTPIPENGGALCLFEYGEDFVIKIQGGDGGQLMNTRTYRPLVPGVGLLTFGIAALPTSIHAAGRLLSAVYTYLGSFSVVLGPVLYLVAKVRGTEKAAARISQTLGALIQSPEYSEDTPGQLSRPQGEEQP